MGRRALGTSYKNVAFESHWLDGCALPDPLTGKAIFGRQAPLEIEVGSGKGLFLQTAASSNPERDFLGIEIARKYTFATASVLSQSDLKNARIIYGDAQPIFRQIPDESVHGVHIYFPDPWWKRKHRKRRIVNHAFIMESHRILRPTGLLHFWTDVQEYFDVAIKMIRQETPFVGPFEVPEKPAAHDFDYRTHFERRMRRHHEPVYRSLFAKRNGLNDAKSVCTSLSSPSPQQPHGSDGETHAG